MDNRNIPFVPPHRDPKYISPRYTQYNPPEDSTVDIQVETVHRLTPEVYRALEQQLDDARVTQQTTEGQAFFKLGVQHVLKTLRDGFTSG